MEDILSILVIILIAVASSKKKNKKKKAGAPESKGPVQFGQDTEKGFSEMKEFIMDVGRNVMDAMEIEDKPAAPVKIKAKPVKTAKPARDADVSVAAAAEPAVPAPVQSGSLRSASIIEEGLSEAPVSTQGRSLFEDHGCAGGSIPHDSHEGDSRYPGAREALAWDDESDAYAGNIAHELQNMDLQGLRRAVVISEILGRPRALRRR